MILSSQIPLANLIEFCRILRHNLAAGLTLRHCFRQQAERGPSAVRPIAQRISEDLEQGDSLQSALKKEKKHFPPLMVSLVTVGEKSGTLPDVFEELEKYFLLQQRLRRQFLGQIAWPMIQFFLAPFVIALMLFFLSMLGSTMAPLGPHYSGPFGAARFLIEFFGTIGLLVALYLIVTRAFKQRAFVEEVLLRLPVLGPTLTALCLMRFCLSLRFTMNTGMSVTNAVRLSMRGTGNAAFDSHADAVCDEIKGGADLTAALRRCRLFPADFLDIMANAEEGGRVVEVMEHQGEYYEDEARRRMTILTRVAGWGVYLLVACFLIFMIFRIASVAYFQPLNEALKGVGM